MCKGSWKATPWAPCQGQVEQHLCLKFATLQSSAHHAAVALDKPSSAQAPPVSPASLPPCIANLLNGVLLFYHMHLQKQWRATLSMPNGSRQCHARQLISMLEWTARHTSYGLHLRCKRTAASREAVKGFHSSAVQVPGSALCAGNALRHSGALKHPAAGWVAASPCLPHPPARKHMSKSKLNSTMRTLQHLQTLVLCRCTLLCFFCSGKLIR